MSDRLRVMVVDDSPSTRTMLREALAMEETIDVVAEAGDGREAVQRAAEASPDVVLMDVRMPDSDGIAAAKAITTQNPETKIVALTWSDDPATVRDMLTAGAMGYVVKGGSIDELVTAIRRAATGGAELDQRVLPAAVEDLRRLLEEERERREQLERLAQARGEFVQVLSHELRSPLTVIAGTLRMLRANGLGENEMPLLETAIRRSSELQFLVEGLELVATSPALEGAADPVEALQRATERLEAAPDESAVQPDTWRGVPQEVLERVTVELLSNAFRHGERPVTVWTERLGGEATLVVTDAGGWAAPDPEFPAFYQENMSSTREKGGFGIGLFVASRLCQSFGGGLAVTSSDGRTLARATFRLDA